MDERAEEVARVRELIYKLAGDLAEAAVPQPELAYVCWSSRTKDFHVSTTDHDYLDGQISMDQIVEWSCESLRDQNDKDALLYAFESAIAEIKAYRV